MRGWAAPSFVSVCAVHPLESSVRHDRIPNASMTQSHAERRARAVYFPKCPTRTSADAMKSSTETRYRGMLPWPTLGMQTRLTSPNVSETMRRLRSKMACRSSSNRGEASKSGITIVVLSSASALLKKLERGGSRKASVRVTHMMMRYCPNESASTVPKTMLDAFDDAMGDAEETRDTGL